MNKFFLTIIISISIFAPKIAFADSILVDPADVRVEIWSAQSTETSAGKLYDYILKVTYRGAVVDSESFYLQVNQEVANRELLRLNATLEEAIKNNKKVRVGHNWSWQAPIRL